MKIAVDDKKIIFKPEGTIDATNADLFREELEKGIEENEGKLPIIDGRDLLYISSAGLRALLKVSKSLPYKLHIGNLSEAVYEIFNVTGFTEILSVIGPDDSNAHSDLLRVNLPEVDVSECTLISKGAYYDVYRVDDETLLRLYSHEVSYDFIISNKSATENAFKLGVPVSITYEVVRGRNFDNENEVGERCGILLEMSSDTTLLDLMKKDREHLADYAKELAQWTQKINSFDVRSLPFGYTIRSQRTLLNRLIEMDVLKKPEVAKLGKVLENIPSGTTYVHHDLTPRNIMVNNKGEYIVYDAYMSACGHPIQDIATICYHFKILPELGIKAQAEGFDNSECELFWRTYLSAYLGSDDEEFLAIAERQIMQFASARSLIFEAIIPSLPGGRSDLLKLKRAALSMCDFIEPLCF